MRIVANPIAFHRSGAATNGAGDEAESGTRPPDTPEPPRWPRLGEHTDRILAERLGFDDLRIAALRAAGAIA